MPDVTQPKDIARRTSGGFGNPSKDQKVKAKLNSTWVQRCLNNVRKFRGERNSLSTEQQLDFIRSQYQVLKVLSKVAEGSAQFRGVSTFTKR